MCGRYTLSTDGETLAAEFGLPDLATWTGKYNIAPSQQIAAIYSRKGSTAAAKLSWGLVPSWAKDKKIGSKLINARSETVAEKPSFRSAFKKRRCLIIADGYYEWVKIEQRKQPYFIYKPQRVPFTFAGLWERWGDDESPYYSCSIITCAANDDLSQLHHRMPVTIETDQFDAWLDPSSDMELIQTMLRPAANGVFNAHAVSTMVNSPANDSPTCIEPLDSAA